MVAVCMSDQTNRPKERKKEHETSLQNRDAQVRNKRGLSMCTVPCLCLLFPIFSLGILLIDGHTRDGSSNWGVSQASPVQRE